MDHYEHSAWSWDAWAQLLGLDGTHQRCCCSEPYWVMAKSIPLGLSNLPWADAVKRSEIKHTY